MTAEITLDQVADRLQTLEKKVQELSSELRNQRVEIPDAGLEFIILVDGQEVWRGQNVSTQYARLRQAYSEAKLAISWQSSPVILV